MKKGVIIGIIVAVVAIISILLIIIKPFGKQGGSTTYTKNQEAKIVEEDISIKVNSVEQVSKKAMMEDSYNDYVKVNVTITNNGNKNETASSYNFDIIDSDGQEISEDSVWIEDDEKLSGDIPAKSSIKGNLYFKTTLRKGMELQYATIENAHMSSDGRLKGNYKYYKIKLD